MSQSNNSVRVEIFDQAYNLRGSDPDYIFKLAEYVDSKMRAVAEQTATIDSARLAVLAALNIADECFRARDEDATRRRTLNSRAEELEKMLDLALGIQVEPAADAAASYPAPNYAR